MRRRALATILLATCGLAAATNVPAATRILYVDGDANGLNDGTSWTNAYRYLQDALADANTGGKPVEIRIAQGAYKPDQGRGRTPGDRAATFRLVDGAVLKGGFAGTKAPEPDARDIQQYQTVLSGDLRGDDSSDYRSLNDNALCLMRGDSVGSATTVEGFAFIGGGWTTDSNQPSCGILLHDSNPAILQCQWASLYGAGRAALACNRSNPSITDCNFAGGWSTGVSFMDRSHPVVTNCTLKSDGPFVVEIQGDSDAYFVNCTLSGMEYCLSATDSNVALVDCRVLKGRMYCYGSNLTMIGCDMVKNLASGIDGDGELKLSRCSFIGNRSDRSDLLRWTGNMSADDCVFTGNAAMLNGIVSITGDVTLNCCRFIGNLSRRGAGALGVGGHKLEAKNCLFTGNLCASGAGAVCASETLLSISNCTFADNRGEPNTIAFSRPDDSSESCIAQCIIRDGPNPFRMDSWGSPEPFGLSITYTDIQGGYPGQGNFDVDPCFVAPGQFQPDPNLRLSGLWGQGPGLAWVQGDYHLRSQAGHWDQRTAAWICDEVTSPCVDAGDPCSALGEEPFPNGGRVNVGDYGGTAEASKSSSIAANGVNAIPCPKLSAAGRPALIYMSLDNQLYCHLYAASFAEGIVQKQEIAWGGCETVTQLDDAVFLVDTPSVEASHVVTVFDLAKGRALPLEENADVRCLRSEPKRGKAMLMQLDTRAQENRLFELDLKTLQVTPRFTLTKAALGERFDRIQAAISPDFTRIIEAEADAPDARGCTYTLRVVDLATMKARDFAKGVRLWMRYASYDQMAPPLEWISDSEVVYQDMPLGPSVSAGTTECQHVLFRANVDTGATVEIYRGMLEPAQDIGMLWVNPLNGELIYRKKWIVDPAAGALTSKDYPFSVTSYSQPTRVKVQRGDVVLYEGAGTIQDTSISSSHRNFTYTLLTSDLIVYVVTASGDKPVEIGRGAFAGPKPVGWIE